MSTVTVVPFTVKLPLTVTSFAKVALLELSKIKLDVLSFLRNIEVLPWAWTTTFSPLDPNICKLSNESSPIKCESPKVILPAKVAFLLLSIFNDSVLELLAPVLMAKV